MDFNSSSLYTQLQWNGLHSQLSMLAQELYDQETGLPRLDRCLILEGNAQGARVPRNTPRYSPEQAIDNALPSHWLDIDAVTFIQQNRDGLVQFLGEAGITALSPWAGGRSAFVFLAWGADDADMQVLRVPTDGIAANHVRCPVPIVVPPTDKACLTNGLWAELLPYVPVLPNWGFHAYQSIPGHSTLVIDKIRILEADGTNRPAMSDRMQDMLAQRLMFLRESLKLAGFGIDTMRDVGILANGSPVLTDPDTLREGMKYPDFSWAQWLEIQNHDGFEGGFAYPPLPTPTGISPTVASSSRPPAPKAGQP